MARYTYTPEFVLERSTAHGIASTGGLTAQDVLECGWVPPDERTPDQSRLADGIIAGMATRPVWLAPDLAEPRPGDKTCLWDPVVKVRGRPFPAYFQVTGSCVGNGGGKAIRYCAFTDIYVRGDAEKFVEEFYLFTYGRSRLRGGLTRPGEGSFGSSFAEAASKDGYLRFDHAGVPRPSDLEKNWSYGRAEELRWSDGDAKPCIDFLTAARSNLVETAQVRSADDVRDAIRSYQPVTIASDWGGQMRCPIKGEPGVLLNSRVTTWMHQMVCTGWMYHPTLGEIFYIENSWSETAHGTCPSGAPKGGFWVLKKDIEYIVRQGDSFRFNGLVGMEPGHIDWTWLRLSM